MSASAVGAAIIGTGMIAAAHRRAIRDSGATPAGLLGSSAERSASTASQCMARGCASRDELLANRPDAVHVYAPNATHLNDALAAFARSPSSTLVSPAPRHPPGRTSDSEYWRTELPPRSTAIYKGSAHD